MKTRGAVLLVDDEPYVRDSLATVLRRRGYAVRTAAGARSALQPETLQGIDVVITDLRMPEQDGLSLLERLSREEPGIPVIVLTGHGTVASAVECMKSGAFDYVLKPANPEALMMILDRALSQCEMRRELDYLRSGGGTRAPLGVSAGWKHVLDLVEAAAPSDASVLLIGESGTGKEVVANLLHRRSARSRRAFVNVNCAAIPLELFESEFFGHRRGAFTGAISDREGRFRVAHRGTLFLDEIGAMPEAAQAKVLRVLQDGVFERLGDSQPTQVDVRLIAATNSDLEAEVQAGRFRRDLYYRVNVMTIPIPPLRERTDDISALAAAFLEEFAVRSSKALREIDAETMANLEAYPWPGNIRELRNVIERAVLLEKTETLLPSSLPFNLRRTKPPTSSPDLNLRRVLAAEERRVLEDALRHSNGVRRDAARLLGIDERNLSYFLKKHGLGRRKRP